MSNLQAHTALRGLTGRRVVLPDVEQVIEQLADDLYHIARRRVSEAGVFHLALSGGSTPMALYQHLVIDPRYRDFPWDKTHLWIVDERCVPFDDEKSNVRMIRELIVDHVSIPKENVHPMPVMEDDGDVQYEQTLRKTLDTAKVRNRLDVVLLGMGGDGHTASLFPRTDALTEKQRWVVFNDGESVAAPRPRMTMTYPLINTARWIIPLVTGEAKHATLQHVALTEDIQRFPITGIHPIHDDTEMTWYIDHAAALGHGGEDG